MRCHVHFGAGNIGIGLVLPIINRDVRCAIINRPLNVVYPEFPEKGEIVLSNGKGFNRSVSILTDKSSHQERMEMFEAWKSGAGNATLILTQQRARFSEFINEADTLSCSIKEGQAQLADDLAQIALEKKPQLIVFENDPHKSLLQSEKVQARKCVLDRVCVDRAFNAERQKLHVTVEDRGWVTIESKGDELREVFNATAEIDLTFGDGASFEYYESRKKFLMNAVHFLIASLGYAQLRNINAPPDRWGVQYVPLISSALFAKEGEALPHIQNYRDGQILRLIQEFPGLVYELNDISKENEDGPDDIETAFDRLQEYSAINLGRIKRSADQLNRVLDIDNPQPLLRKTERFLDESRSYFWTNQEEINSMKIRNRPHADDILWSIDYVKDAILQAKIPNKTVP